MRRFEPPKIRKTLPPRAAESGDQPTLKQPKQRIFVPPLMAPPKHLVEGDPTETDMGDLRAHLRARFAQARAEAEAEALDTTDTTEVPTREEPIPSRAAVVVTSSAAEDEEDGVTAPRGQPATMLPSEPPATRARPSSGVRLNYETSSNYLVLASDEVEYADFTGEDDDETRAMPRDALQRRQAPVDLQPVQDAAPEAPAPQREVAKPDVAPPSEVLPRRTATLVDADEIPPAPATLPMLLTDSRPVPAAPHAPPRGGGETTSVAPLQAPVPANVHPAPIYATAPPLYAPAPTYPPPPPPRPRTEPMAPPFATLPAVPGYVHAMPAQAPPVAVVAPQKTRPRYLLWVAYGLLVGGFGVMFGARYFRSIGAAPVAPIATAATLPNGAATQVPVPPQIAAPPQLAVTQAVSAPLVAASSRAIPPAQQNVPKVQGGARPPVSGAKPVVASTAKPEGPRLPQSMDPPQPPPQPTAPSPGDILTDAL